MDALTAALGIAGVVGTLGGALGGAWMQARMTAKAARHDRIFAAKIDLYVDALALAQRVEGWIGQLTNSARGYRPRSAANVDWDLTSARVRLLAASDVRTAWQALTEHHHNMWTWLNHEVKIKEGQSIPADAEHVVRVRAAVEALHVAIDADMKDHSGTGRSRPA